MTARSQSQDDAVRLAKNRNACSAHIEAALDAVGMHDAAFTRIYAEAAIAHAATVDTRRAQGVERLTALAGMPITIKDNMDVAGEPTAAGSRVLAETASPAATDADVVKRLRTAGAIILGKTAMAELALSSVGLIEATGQLPNPLDPERVPGGSSCGAAVSVAVGAASAALGTDTGGSVQIPAALCGLVGFKPTASQISREGVVPLSQHLDSVGVIAHSVRCCRMVYEALAQNPATSFPDQVPRSIKGLRFAVPQNYVLNDLEPAVAAAFERTLSVLSKHGAVLQDIDLPAFDRVPDVYQGGGFSMAELYAWLRSRGSLTRSLISSRAYSRIEQGGVLLAADMLDRLSLRASLVESAAQQTSRWDALLMPTCPILPPFIRAVADDDGYNRYSMLLMRNTRVANVLDRCAVTLPVNDRDGLPVGMMLMGLRGQDDALLGIAEAVEGLLPRRIA
ncbi:MULTISPECIES: amidase family protein [unclassified Paraburkholderia]|uniref:amidase family protein n=1 Tax=unclassified Paraburkholderia TaxID=2615204 RepID=UPI000E282B12|nr:MULTISPECIES: amidase family protein [unclassified Paraburkholderia]REG49151.1 aspartyl-tRNA(Asn)/glutamyl-tRNA(Gln) amidotransferase subunit A [Paraburkholderia sp. BL6669N2]RKR36157.1 aspartyl-tRNA(Asn)/glutamyl-tRNA(Gln) amidotransferase subunit A [Paraburkholderia sp. BL17N1]